MSEEEYWDTPEFDQVRALVDEFMQSTGVEGISNSQHGMYVAEDFCSWMQNSYPSVHAECKGKEIIYRSALVDWAIDNNYN